MKRLAFALLLAAFSPALAGAQEVTVKLGTLAPVGSSWHNLLLEMGEKWSAASGGKVKLKVYAGGSLGNEGDMIRKIGVGFLNAASVTVVGMHDITPEPQSISTPMMIMSNDEFDYVMPRVQPRFEQALEKKGFVVLNWGQVGFVRIFCTKAYQSPAEMKDGKIFAWDGDPASVEAWKAGGFHPVVLSSHDIVPSLQTGMITCVPDPPLYVFTARMFEKANKMMDVNWGLLVGATIVRKDQWEKIPADVRPKLLEIARDAGKKTEVEVRRMNEEAVETMKKQGLEVVKPASLLPWQKSAEDAWKVVRGGVVPAEAFDAVLKYRDEYRAGKKG